MKTEYEDLGAGWFLFENELDRVTVIADSTSLDPDKYFGPAAWDGKDGPLSGRILFEAVPLDKGSWGQVGPHTWKWITEEMEELDEAPLGWPRVVEIKGSLRQESNYARSEALLESIAGTLVASRDELVRLIRLRTKSLPQVELMLVSAEARLHSAKLTFPHIFGEVEFADLPQ